MAVRSRVAAIRISPCKSNRFLLGRDDADALPYKGCPRSPAKDMHRVTCKVTHRCSLKGCTTRQLLCNRHSAPGSAPCRLHGRKGFRIFGGFFLQSGLGHWSAERNPRGNTGLGTDISTTNSFVLTMSSLGRAGKEMANIVELFQRMINIL